MNRLLVAGVVGAVAGVAISACMVDREGAPCDRDDNCPRSQYCDLTNHCVELKPSLEAATACQLVLVSLSQKFSECAGGRPQDWLELFGPDAICRTYTGSVTAGRATYAPMQLKVCRAALFSDACDDLATRKAGQMLADCPLYSGAVGAAGGCATDKDCAAGFCDTTGGCLGVCRPFTPAGTACGATDVCEPGATCSGGTCKRYITSGACDADAGPCQPFSHYCSGGTCVPREPQGTPNCAYTGAGNFCQSDLNCVGALFGGKICQRGVAIDQPCTGFTNSCDRFTSCMTRDGGATLCTLWPGPGGACGLPAGSQDIVLCRQSRCNAFNCVDYAPLGTGCASDADCGALARCVAGICRSEFCP